jgi:mannose-6-phosphate isomerase-like protein (cupin superfamily)
MQETVGRHDTSVQKVSARTAPVGEMGQRYLACGLSMGMRLWVEEGPIGEKEPAEREYETLGFVIQGRAELELEGQVVTLEPGDSWVVPKGARHTYNILEKFVAVEVTSPPAQVQGRDEPVSIS